jgi:hypothetical protein
MLKNSDEGEFKMAHHQQKSKEWKILH